MIKKIDFSKIPNTPGVYRFINGSGKVVYVGKAKNLSSRLSYYLNCDPKILLDKTSRLINEAEGLSWTKTDSEIEALILEANLINSLKPKYNSVLKNNRSYSYVLIEKIGSKPEGAYPRVLITRKKIAGLGEYFGPFPNGFSLRKLLRVLRRIFPFRDCGPAKFNYYRKLGRGCLLGEIGLCPAPCAMDDRFGLVDYGKNLAALRRFLKGRGDGYLKALEREMRDVSARLDFEKAIEIKSRIEKMKVLISRPLPSDLYLENPNLYEDLRIEELTDLEAFLRPFFPEIRLKGIRSRIEAFDISNLGVDDPVGAMTVFNRGSKDTGSYRKFKIRKEKGINDLRMMAEVIRRRFKNPGWPRPDLILIDGGLGHLSAVSGILTELKIPFIGLAKKEEKVAVNNGYLKIPKSRPALRLLMRIRDETHRFVISFQRASRRLSK